MLLEISTKYIYVYIFFQNQDLYYHFCLNFSGMSPCFFPILKAVVLVPKRKLWKSFKMNKGFSPLYNLTKIDFLCNLPKINWCAVNEWLVSYSASHWRIEYHYKLFQARHFAMSYLNRCKVLLPIGIGVPSPRQGATRVGARDPQGRDGAVRIPRLVPTIDDRHVHLILGTTQNLLLLLL